jgi:hypothetical protein
MCGWQPSEIALLSVIVGMMLIGVIHAFRMND